MSSLPLLLLLAQVGAPTSIPGSTPVHLGITLRLTHAEELATLRTAQSTPGAPEYRRWLSPAEFGARFGQPAATYEGLASFLAEGGLAVERSPNRLFLQATGTAAQVQALLGARLGPVAGKPASVHTLLSTPRFPNAFAAQVLDVSGLDTRVRYQRRLLAPDGTKMMGPQDLRRFYGLQPLLAQGYVGQGQKLAVLSTATEPGKGPDAVAIRWYLRNVSDARAPYLEHVIANPGLDYDTQPGVAEEFTLDVEMQSVGAPGADRIVLVVAPASEVFTTGAQEIVNALPETTAVSISLGLCEGYALQNDHTSGRDEIGALRQAVTQGLVEGQTWSAATGDNGANDCQGGNTAAVDFPSVIPEMVAVGGTMLSAPQWNANHALLGYQQEVTWNGGAQGGAGGGGLSTLFPRPAYQQSLGLAGTGRSVPDIALIAGAPGVAVGSYSPPGPLSPTMGTSVASPVSAGIFALIASRTGCRLGDVHPALYQLGQAQQDGGTAVFHDITAGNLNQGGVTGPSATPGYDSATGWGALDVAALAEAWPGCPLPPDAGLDDGGVVDAGGPFDAGPLTPYLPCEFLACDGGTSCLTVADGPSGCLQPCDPTAATESCPTATICSDQTAFTPMLPGACVPGCRTTADCAEKPGSLCAPCDHVCVRPGAANAAIGDECSDNTHCPSMGFCFASRLFNGGYCSMSCKRGTAAGGVCSCPTGSVCGEIGPFGETACLKECGYVGQDCGRDGYVCQPQTSGSLACLPACRVLTYGSQTFDTCNYLGTSEACDEPSGLCGGPKPRPVPDAGTPDPAPVNVAALGDQLGPVNKACGCSSAGASQVGVLALAALLLRRRRA